LMSSCLTLLWSATVEDLSPTAHALRSFSLANSQHASPHLLPSRRCCGEPTARSLARVHVASSVARPQGLSPLAKPLQNAPPLPVECCPLLPWASRSVVCIVRPVAHRSYGLAAISVKPKAAGLLVHPEQAQGQQPPSPMVLIGSAMQSRRAARPKRRRPQRRPTWIAPRHPLCSWRELTTEVASRADRRIHRSGSRFTFRRRMSVPSHMQSAGPAKLPSLRDAQGRRSCTAARLIRGRLIHRRLSTRDAVTDITSTRVVERSRTAADGLHQPDGEPSVTSATHAQLQPPTPHRQDKPGRAVAVRPSTSRRTSFATKKRTVACCCGSAGPPPPLTHR